MNINLEQIIMGNSLKNYLISLGIIFFGIIMVKLLKIFLKSKLYKFIQEKSNWIPENLWKTINRRLSPLVYILFVNTAFDRLKITHFLARIIHYILLVLAVIFAGLFINDLSILLIKRYWDRKNDGKEKLKFMQLMMTVVKVIIWVLALVFVLDNMGIKITGLLTGLGVGGVAVAFAAQAVLSDIFSYFTIILDQPFDVGDFIIVGEDKGTIEHIGIKTTRIRSLGGEQLVLPNKDLTSSRINNYTRMEKRRIQFSFGVVYGTDLKQLQEIPALVEEIINEIDITLFDRAHFSEFGPSSLIVNTVYYVLDNDYKTYMDTQQKINFRLKEELGRRDVEFAFPTQTLYVKNENKKTEDKKNEDDENKKTESV